jgi:hypothetical protein
MCPACVAGAALMAGSVISTGGITALAVRVVRGKKSGRDETSNDNSDGDLQRTERKEKSIWRR